MPTEYNDLPISLKQLIGHYLQKEELYPKQEVVSDLAEKKSEPLKDENEIKQLLQKNKYELDIQADLSGYYPATNVDTCEYTKKPWEYCYSSTKSSSVNCDFGWVLNCTSACALFTSAPFGWCCNYRIKGCCFNCQLVSYTVPVGIACCPVATTLSVVGLFADAGRLAKHKYEDVIGFREANTRKAAFQSVADFIVGTEKAPPSRQVMK